jgi:glycosyltransferase involved in cell wall biosynthesis
MTVAACPLPARRGTPIRIFRLAEALKANGVAVEVLAYHLGDQDSISNFKLNRIDDIRWYKRTTAGPTYKKLLVDWRLAKKLEQLLTKGSFDVIHAHHYEGLMCALYANRKTKLPLIFDAHTLLSSELPSYSLGLPKFVKRYIGKIIDNTLPKRATHVVAVSENIEQRLVTEFGLNLAAISIVPNGTEIAFLSSCLRQKSKRPIVLFAGNLAAYQDIDILLQAFALLKKRDPQPMLRIVTDDDFSPYRKMVADLGFEEYLEIMPGEFDRLPEHLASAAVAVNPRRICDGVPQKLLNYMAAACPVVSFRGSARHVTHNESAWIAEEPTAACLALGIDELLDNPQRAQELGANAARIVINELSWDRAARDIERISRRLLNTHD